jgi:hypothetical protein
MQADSDAGAKHSGYHGLGAAGEDGPGDQVVAVDLHSFVGSRRHVVTPHRGIVIYDLYHYHYSKASNFSSIVYVFQ